MEIKYKRNCVSWDSGCGDLESDWDDVSYVIETNKAYNTVKKLIARDYDLDLKNEKHVKLLKLVFEDFTEYTSDEFEEFLYELYETELQEIFYENAKEELGEHITY